MAKNPCFGFGADYGSLGSVSFWPPGSGFGSVIILTSKKIKKNLDFNCFVILNDLLTLKADVNVHTKVISKKTWKKNLFLLAS